VKEIEFTSAAVRQWRKLTVTTRTQFDLKLKAFAETGSGDVKALKGDCARVIGASCLR
jgi:mRNA interferase RelE/StbE